MTFFSLQDCVCLVAPHPFLNEPLDEFNVTRDFDITGAGKVWYARLQLFFKCTLFSSAHFPRDVTVADAVAAMRKQRIEESRARGAATHQRRREQAPGPQ
jgi:hypothetical protein